MKAVLVAVNAKFIHTNPAVRSIAVCLESASFKAEIVEAHTGSPVRSVLSQLYDKDGDVYFFSCYIWNIDMILRLASDLKHVIPEALFVAAGPQAGSSPEEFLRENPGFDFVLYGEGEEAAPRLLSAISQGGGYEDCGNLAFRHGGGIKVNPPLDPVDMDSLPFAYRDIGEVKDRILYYESMRGCPFQCSYCLSAGNGVRVRSVDLVCTDLDRFLAARVRQVKFVDRTFNAVKEHAAAVWEYLIRRDNGVTNFHFELSGELLDEELFLLLEKARSGLFQFEIGVQSVNPETLGAIRRPGLFDLLAKNVKRLKAMGNIHLHLDLIAGLPHEGFESFARSFDLVHDLGPDQLQLGFLKVLPGTEMERTAPEHGIAYSRYAPFEVLQTPCLGYGELLELHGVADMVELYHNSSRFTKIMGYILSHFESAFACYRQLWGFYRDRGHAAVPLSKIGYYELLKPFMERCCIPVSERAKWLCKYDLLSMEKPRKTVSWVDLDLSPDYSNPILEFLGREEIISRYLPSYKGMEPKQLRRIVHVEVFPFSPTTMEETAAAVLFDYQNGEVYTLTVDKDTGRIG